MSRPRKPWDYEHYRVSIFEPAENIEDHIDWTGSPNAKLTWTQLEGGLMKAVDSRSHISFILSMETGALVSLSLGEDEVECSKRLELILEPIPVQFYVSVKRCTTYNFH